MTAFAEILRVVLAALAQAGIAFHAGYRNAQDRQKQTDERAADNAIEARRTAGTGDRDDLIDRLQETGNLRD